MSSKKSYGQILRSTSIIGGASVLNIMLGLIRIKVAALILGPAGVGLIGLLNNLIGTASSVAALGVGTVGTRQIAEASGRKDATQIAATRRALFWGTLALAVVGTAAFWMLRGVLATHVLANAALSHEVGWLALGVGLTVAAGSQSALLNGLRRIGDLARVSVFSALLSTALGVGALLMWRERGLLIFLLISPVASFVFGHVYVARLPKVQSRPTQLGELVQQWHILARLGVAFMLAGLAVTVGQLLVRNLVQRQLGTEALGYFEASWVISMTYIGFVLKAMGTDYYPRLTAVIRDHTAVNRLVNEQTEVALLLAGPVFLAMLGLAPWVIELLYSSRFSAATAVLRWQILGDILKVVSWPLGYILLAAGVGRTYMISETLAIVVFVLCVWLGLPYLGLQATGVGFLVMYVFYLPLVYWLANQRTEFRWATTVWRLLGCLVFSAVLLLVTAQWSALTAALAGLSMSAGFGLYSFGRLAHKTNLKGPLGRLAAKSQQWLMKMGVWRG